MTKNSTLDLIKEYQAASPEHQVMAVNNTNGILFETKIIGYELANSSLVRALIDLLGSLINLKQHKESLFTVLSELYANALDHGVLGLSSSIKNEPDGFSRYLELKNQKIASLANDYIIIKLSLKKTNTINELSIYFEDSGKGFQYDNSEEKPLPSITSLSGRGIYMINSLCHKLEFHGAGNQSTATYQWPI